MSCPNFLRATPSRRAGLALFLLSPILGALVGVASLPAAAQAVTTREVMLPASGRVRGAAEDVTFSGQVRIQSAVIPDVEGKEAPVAEITVDFSNVSGKGVSSRAAYTATSSVTLHRHVLPSETVEVQFPYYPAGKPLAAQSALASFQVYNGSTTSKSVTISTNPAN